MKDWWRNIKVLQWIAGVLAVISTFLGITVWSYDGRIEYLKTENIEQEKEIIRLKGYKNEHIDEFHNVYDLFHDYNLRIKTLEDE